MLCYLCPLETYLPHVLIPNSECLTKAKRNHSRHRRAPKTRCHSCSTARVWYLLVPAPCWQPALRYLWWQVQPSTDSKGRERSLQYDAHYPQRTLRGPFHWDFTNYHKRDNKSESLPFHCLQAFPPAAMGQCQTCHRPLLAPVWNKSYIWRAVKSAS